MKGPMAVMLLIWLSLLVHTDASDPVSKVGAMVFQSSAQVMQMSPTLDSIRPYVEHVFICQPRSASLEMEGYLSEWSRHTGIPGIVHKGTRNACLRVYASMADPAVTTLLLVEWNMRLQVNGTVPWLEWYDHEGPEYALAPDQSGLVLDWSPIVMRVGARCGYLGRFICVSSDTAHRHLLQVEYELDVDKNTRHLIEREMISLQDHRPLVLPNLFISRQPPRNQPPNPSPALQRAQQGSPPPEPPADTQFAYAWYWMGRECEARMEGDMARHAYTMRLDVTGDPGDLWYALYRLGDMATESDQAIRLLLEAYNVQPKRREPLAALTRRYADEGKYMLCRLFGSTALAIPFPTGPETGPHVEVPVYEWMVADELSICLARTGRTDDAAQLAAHIVDNPHLTTLPEDQRKRIAANVAAWRPVKKGKTK